MSGTYISSGSFVGLSVSGGFFAGRDTLIVTGSGVVTSTTADGGNLFVSAGGIAYATTVGSSALLDVGSGGTAFGATASYGGEIGVGTDGVAQNLTLDEGSGLVVYGFASSVIIDAPADEEVVSGGTQVGLFLGAGGYAFVEGTDQADTVASGGTLYVGGTGTDYGAIVASGGTMQVVSGGVASGFTVQNGGFELIQPGGTAAGTVAAGGTLVLAGGGNAGLVVQTGGVVISGGVVFRDGSTGVNSAGATFTGDVVSGFRTAQYVLSGGVASDTTLTSGGTEYVFTGGTSVNDMIVQNEYGYSGDVVALSGGVVDYPTILGGVAAVSGGMIFGATVGSGGGGNPGQLYLDAGETSGTVLESGGTQHVFLGLAAATTIESGGTLDVGGYVYDQDGYLTASSDNTTIMSGGVENLINGAVASNTTIEGGFLNVFSPTPKDMGDGAAAGGLDFVGSGGQARIDVSDLPNLVVSGLGIGDSILIGGVAGGNESATVTTPGTVTLNFDSTSYDLAVTGATSNSHYLLIDNVLTVGPPCFAAGTRILTARGEILVEKLGVGDTVITKDGEDAPIVWIGHRRLDLTRHPRPEQARPVRIAADALDEGVPRRDLLLSPDHALFIDGALIPAKALLNDRNIMQLTPKTVTYFHIELAEHSVIFAENCAVETYLETGNRGAFANAAGALTLHADFAQTLRETKSCAPFTDSGAILEAAREQTMRRHGTVLSATRARR